MRNAPDNSSAVWLHDSFTQCVKSKTNLKDYNETCQEEKNTSGTHSFCLSLQLCLRQQMGDDKYHAYAVMVRQLKFFEEVALEV